MGDGTTTARDDMVAALLGAAMVAGVYLDGWAHLHLATVDSFFTPWHALLYGAFALAAAWSVALVLLRGRQGTPWRSRIPRGYGWGLVGVAVFGVGGLLDMAWHLAFGVETGLDALVSPTHLLLLVGGILLVASPVRSALVADRPGHGAAVLALAACGSAGRILPELRVGVRRTRRPGSRSSRCRRERPGIGPRSWRPPWAWAAI